MGFSKASSYFGALSDEDKLFVSKICDMARRCTGRQIRSFTPFLDERETALAVSVLNAERFDNYGVFGGVASAERRMIGLFPDYAEPCDDEFPIKIISFTYRRCDTLSHRDFLGAIMSCGVKRDMIGDIIVGEGLANVFVSENICDFLVSGIERVGKVGVAVAVVDKPQLSAEKRLSEISGTVASLRLDCIVSLSAGIGRDKASELIKKTGVDINHEKCFAPDRILSIGDVISLRGFGRFVLFEAGGVSRKNRTFIKIGKYI